MRVERIIERERGSVRFFALLLFWGFASTAPIKAQISYTFTTLAGLAGNAGSTDGSGSAARFNFPLGIAIDGAGNLYIADSGNFTVRKVSSSGTVSTLAGSPGNQGSADGVGALARFGGPTGIAVDSAGNLFLSDSINNTIRKISPGGVVTTLAGQAGVAGYADGPGSSARFYRPLGIALDGLGNLYVVDNLNGELRKISADGTVSTLAGGGDASEINGPLSSAQFTSPSGIAIDRLSGNIYICDVGAIRKVTPAGIVTTLAGGITVNGYADGIGSAAGFTDPYGITTDASGNIYVADYGTNSIRRVTPDGVVTTVAGGVPGSADGTATGAQFLRPCGVVTNSSGTLYVADTYNSTLRAGIPSASLTFLAASTAAGTVGQAFSYQVATSVAPNTYSASGLPPGLTLNPATGIISGTPIAAGTFNVVLGATTATGTVTSNVVATIAPGLATIILSPLAATSDGTPKSVTATTTPAGLNYSITYNGSPTPPSAAGAYAVVATITSGYYTGSASGVLVINPPTPPSISTQPKSQSVTANTPASLSVAATGSPPFTYQWYFNGAPLSGYTGSTLIFYSAAPSETGSYTVAVTNAAGSVTSQAAILTVNVAAPGSPTIISGPQSGGVYVGSNLTLSVNVSTNAAYQWNFNGTAIIGATSPTYSLNNIQPANAGSYTVTASNSFGSITSQAAIISVEPNPAGQPYIDQQPTNVTAVPGTNATFSVDAEVSSPFSPLSYQWFFNGVPIPGATASKYTITNVQAANAGSYTATASTNAGTATSTAAVLTVLAPGSPTITTPPRSEDVYAGQTATLSVVASGTAPLSYQWYFAGSPIAGANNSSYTIPKTVAANSGSYTVSITNGAGSATSSAAYLGVSPAIVTAPAIVTPPQSTSANIGGNATFWVIASGNAPLTYQWYDNGFNPIAGATGASYTLNSVQSGNAGTYTVVVTDAGGSASAHATLTLNAANNPGPTEIFEQQPIGVSVASGSTAVFSASATNATSYQWFLNGAAIPSANQSLLIVPNSTSANAGNYTCVALNVSGSVASQAAPLSIVNTSDPGRLINLSCRAQVGTGANILIAGFVTGGQGTSGNQSLLIRASGPALGSFGVSGYLIDPSLTLNGANAVLASNNSWGGSAAISAAASATGAFPWTTSSSHDAALLENLTAGSCSASVSGANGDTGIALAEIYDATPPGSYQSTSPRLINLSARVEVGGGSAALIAGFVIGGSTAKTVLIRASGPALLPFGVTGVLQDPQLQLSSGSSTLSTNSGWAGNSQIAATAAAVGAFAWSNPLSNDSALLLTLSPGAYTASVTGFYGDSGVALVEIYDVP